jgi:hypothetical protein
MARVRWALIGLYVSLVALAALTPFSSDANADHTCSSGRQLVGDMTGDARNDRVSLAGQWLEKYGCRYSLVVDSREARFSLRLREGLLEAPRVSPEARIADLSGLARIDRRPGAEILVTLGRGASSSGVGVYTVRPGRLQNLQIRQRYQEGLFWEVQGGTYGSVTDCWRGPGSGLVISSSRELSDSRWPDVDRRLFRVEGVRFRLVWHRRYFRTRQRFPEFYSPGAGLFASCRTPG